MNNKKKLCLALLPAILSLSLSALARDASDIVPKNLHAPSLAKSAALPGMELSRDTIQYSWNLDTSAKIGSPQPYQAVSREYFVEANADQLRSGISLKTSAAGAVIKLSPRGNIQKSTRQLGRDDIAVSVAGNVVSLGAFASTLDDSSKFAEMQKSGVAFAPGSLAFQINESLGATSFKLVVKNANIDYLVHVFEPQSPYAVTLSTSREAYLTGESISVNAKLATDAAAGNADIVELNGGIASPHGDVSAISFVRGQDGTFTGHTTVNESAVGELYEAFVTATLRDGSTVVLRDAKVGFAVGDATAKIVNVARAGSTASTADRQDFHAVVSVSAAGRYQLEAVMFADRNGERIPVAVAQTGAWLESGRQAITLSFADLKLASRNIGGAFTLGNIVLKNQGTLAVMERRATIDLADDAGGDGSGGRGNNLRTTTLR